MSNGHRWNPETRVPQPQRGSAATRLSKWAVPLLLSLGVMLLGAGCRAPRAIVTHPTVLMPDGIRLATDVILPSSLAHGTLPTVLIQTRYWRSFRLRGGGGKGRIPQGPREPIVSRLVAAGFAVVVVDVRGTGASDGSWRWPWSTEEVADMGPLIDWIVAQPWSNGAVGATGVSYEGTTALLAATANRPALKAVLARQLEWDLADETLAPGGVRNVAFVDSWSRSANALDRGAYPEIFPRYAKWVVSGVQRRGDDADGRALRATQQARLPANVADRVKAVRKRSDAFGNDGPPTHSLGPSGHEQALAKSRAVIGMWGSWWDGATADAVFRAGLVAPLREAVIGPWDHEGTSNASPLRSSASENATVALDSVVSFFNRHLREQANGAAAVNRATWYVAGAESWRSASTWPATRERTWMVAEASVADRLVETSLQASVDRHVSDSTNGSIAHVSDVLPVNFSASTGTRNRWTSGLARRVDAPNRANAPGVLWWRTPPFRSALAVFGAGDFACDVSLDAPEAALHVYLESVDTRGVVRLLSEGTRRVNANEALSGKTVVRIRPVAFELPTGWALRVSIAGADAPTFERVPERGAQQIRVSDCRLMLNVLANAGD